MLLEAKLASEIVWRRWRPPSSAEFNNACSFTYILPQHDFIPWTKKLSFLPKTKPGFASLFPDTMVTRPSHLIFNNILSFSQKHIRIKHAAK